MNNRAIYEPLSTATTPQQRFDPSCNSQQRSSTHAKHWKWLFRILVAFSMLYLSIAFYIIHKMSFADMNLQSALVTSFLTNMAKPAQLLEPASATPSVHDWKSQQSTVEELRSQVSQLTERLVHLQQTPANHGTKEKAPVVNSEFATAEVLATLPPTSVWCMGERKERRCTFRNLYFDSRINEFIMVKSKDSVIVGMDGVDLRNILDLTTIEEHNAFFFSVVEVTATHYVAERVQRVRKNTFILSRFHTGNIMHAIHDDFFGLYMQHKQFSSASTSASLHELESFSRDNFVMFCDGHDEGSYGHVFKFLTENPLQFRKQLIESKEMFWFPECVVGNSKQLTWYQYGFLVPQGPLPGKKVNGFHVREAGNYISHKLSLPKFDADDWQSMLKKIIANASTPSSDSATAALLSNDYFIAVFSRRHDRFILNEDDIARNLQQRFKLPVQFIRNEDLSFAEQVKILRKTAIAIGMHGSLLIMGMFMMPGSVLIELYPYAVPCNNYTPYKTMCGLHGMNISYRAWSNTHPENNVSHPGRIPHYGGIKHLSEEEQIKITTTPTVPLHLCCTNPYWLFRIFQDTTVDWNELEATIIDALQESSSQLHSFLNYTPSITPGSVQNAKCSFDKQTGTVHLTWELPRNIQSNHKDIQFLIWSHEHFKEFSSDTTKFTIDNCNPLKTYDFWIKAVSKNNSTASSGYSDKISCEAQ